MTLATIQNARSTRAALWTLQGLLAALFLFAGGMKLVMPIAVLTQQTPLPGAFLRFIGVLEVAGGLGLVLPGLLRLRPVLTPLAAAGLVIVMSGATGASMASPHPASAVAPVVAGVLLFIVGLARMPRAHTR